MEPGVDPSSGPDTMVDVDARGGVNTERASVESNGCISSASQIRKRWNQDKQKNHLKEVNFVHVSLKGCTLP
jgi:hypothetical protein